MHGAGNGVAFKPVKCHTNYFSFCLFQTMSERQSSENKSETPKQKQSRLLISLGIDPKRLERQRSTAEWISKTVKEIQKISEKKQN